jgi:hypothetical protein
VADGREQVMRDVVWHAVLELYRASPIAPPEASWPALAEAAYEGYERKVTTRIPVVSLRDGLEQEGRGHTAFWQKFRTAMRRWGDEGFVADASSPAPEGEGPGRASEPPNRTNREGEDGSNCTISPIPLVSAFPIDEASLPVRDWSVPWLRPGQWGSIRRGSRGTFC